MSEKDAAHSRVDEIELRRLLHNLVSAAARVADTRLPPQASEMQRDDAVNELASFMMRVIAERNKRSGT